MFLIISNDGQEEAINLNEIKRIKKDPDGVQAVLVLNGINRRVDQKFDVLMETLRLRGLAIVPVTT
jgi:hypothetical protein